MKEYFLPVGPGLACTLHHSHLSRHACDLGPAAFLIPFCDIRKGSSPGCDDTGHVFCTGKNSCHELAHDLSIAQDISRKFFWTGSSHWPPVQSPSFRCLYISTGCPSVFFQEAQPLMDWFMTTTPAWDGEHSPRSKSSRRIPLLSRGALSLPLLPLWALRGLPGAYSWMQHPYAVEELPSRM